MKNLIYNQSFVLFNNSNVDNEMIRSFITLFKCIFVNFKFITNEKELALLNNVDILIIYDSYVVPFINDNVHNDIGLKYYINNSGNMTNSLLNSLNKLNFDYIFSNLNHHNFIIKKIINDLNLKKLINQKNTFLQNLKNENNFKEIIESMNFHSMKPYFQPIYDNNKNSINKYEALARIVVKNKIYYPNDFIPIFKSLERTDIITKSIFSQCFLLINNSNEQISLNISVKDIINRDTNVFIFNLLNKCNKCENITFEILEDENILFFKNEIIKFINEIRSFGCKIALDDFGTGYSNFVNFINFPIDYMKMDGSVVKLLDTDYTKAKPIIKKMISIAHDIGARTIAEFVDSKELQEKVRDIGFDFSQGYYFGKPKDKIL
jgi:EAL domain-containing protein (putative c-di-GMP-specific phosphodiesterase class I)